MRDVVKKSAELFYMAKGFIPEWLYQSSSAEVVGIYDSYLSRLWGNEEAYIRRDGFEEAWEAYVIYMDDYDNEKQLAAEKIAARQQKGETK